MKTIVTVVKDNGMVICKDKLFTLTNKNITLNPYNHLPIEETKFYFVVRQIDDSINLLKEKKDANID